MAEIGRTFRKEALQRTTEGNEGARLIGSRLAGVAGTTVQAMLAGLKTLVDSKAASDDSRLSDQRVPTDGSVTLAKTAAALRDAAAATASLRTLGLGAQQAAPGPHLHDDRYFTETESDGRFEQLARRGQASGYAGLDGSGKVPTGQLPDTVLGGMDYQGTWDAATNTPALGSVAKSKGDYWRVAVAGSTSQSNITDWKVGDWAVWNGSSFDKIDNTDQVTSVDGRQGPVDLSGRYAAKSHEGSRDGHPAATAQENGLMPATDKARAHDRNHGLFSPDHPDVDTTVARTDGSVPTWSAGAQRYVHQQPAAAQSVPPGAMTEFAGFSAPAGWLPADGAAVSRSTFAALFEASTVQTAGTTAQNSAVVVGVGSTAQLRPGYPVEGPGVPAGTTILTVDSANQITLSALAVAGAGAGTIRALPWGAGDGSTTFNLPDPRGRSLIGAGAGAGLTNRRVAERTGSETHALSVGQLPEHKHEVFHNRNDNAPTTGSGIKVSSIVSSGGSNTANTGLGDTVGAAQGHPNMQPSLAVNYIVKT